jgi:hypothetical protein
MTMFDSHTLNFIYGHDYDYVWLTHSLNFIYGHEYDYVWLTHSLNFIYGHGYDYVWLETVCETNIVIVSAIDKV